LPWADSVYAKIVAYNIYGESTISDAGNGAIILTEPDAPLALAENIATRGATQIGLTWSKAAEEGGSPVIDY
jgi:hypothetical protein